MPLTLIIGPMKSGKSLELLAQATPFKFSNKSVCFYQPKLNVRDNAIKSRIGSLQEAVKIDSLKDVSEECDVIVIDELNMFQESDIKYVKKWLDSGKEVFVASLDLDYRAKMFPIVHELLQVKPDVIVSKTAICDVCKEDKALFTQITDDGKPIKNLDTSIIPEDGTYHYEARCRSCFIS